MDMGFPFGGYENVLKLNRGDGCNWHLHVRSVNCSI